nr:MAG TPA: hypothetical protein [Caudoviricetes sp.]
MRQSEPLWAGSSTAAFQRPATAETWMLLIWTTFRISVRT